MARVPHDALRGPALALGALVCLAASATAQNEASAVALPPVRLSSVEMKRLVVTAVPPHYPSMARINYIQGHVRMELLLSPRGNVMQAHVIKGHAFLAAAALSTVRRWKFRPYRLARHARRVLGIVDVHFILRSRRLEHPPPAPEAYLSRQVNPPHMLPGAFPASDELVPMRVLIGKHGDVLDSVPDGADPKQSVEARQALKHLKFVPAHWGALAVPWYLQVQVPVAR